MTTAIEQRAAALKEFETIGKAVGQSGLDQFQDITLSEALVLGLMNQGVKTYIGIFGHGSTDMGNVLRTYEEAGLIKTVQVRNEVEASHIAASLRWQYGETPAVFTSIGPGALQAMAGSLTPLSLGLGVYYIFGDETTHSEGPNMQQIPGHRQESFLKLCSLMSETYTLHTPEAVFTALKRGTATVHNRAAEKPFFLLMPMNTQPAMMKNCNLLEFPVRAELPGQICADDELFAEAVGLISRSERITVKAGGGASTVDSDILQEFLELSDSVYVHGPVVPGLIPGSSPRNMTVGGSKGSISGNYAMENCDLLIVIGARGVCQWDSSGTAFKKARNIISINTDVYDAVHYNKTLPLLGDASLILKKLIAVMKNGNVVKSGETASPWLTSCREKRNEWEAFKEKRYTSGPIRDLKRDMDLLPQPAAIKTAVDFADSIGAVKYFDAGDVQANGFQIVCDEKPGMTFTDTGASYMGFAASAILSSALVDDPAYPVAFCGDGSFMMNPQILIDAVEHGLNGMIILFDNRRMAAISGLQQAQYGRDYRTDDSVAVDYCRMADSVGGVKSFFGGNTREELRKALEQAYGHRGLSFVHVPVYYGEDEMGGMGVFGNWNVGCWCSDVQREKHRIGL